MTEKQEKEGDLLFPQERREYPRVALNVKVRYRVLGDSKEDTELVKKFDPEEIFRVFKENETVNISTSGLLMYSDESIPEKAIAAVNFYMPLPGLSCTCAALAETIRCIKTVSGRYLVALKFLKIIHHDTTKYKYLTLTEILAIKGAEIKLD
ncbi:MAG: PilZ domain-containing protein [Candidatus Goldbacteria bacterium]|nr:PilZ domain-containing protein [Candidatus Goldiibacteriota bacterium]